MSARSGGSSATPEDQPARRTRVGTLPNLTVRGRAFVAAGATILLCAVVFGQTALLRIGVLVEALPWLAALPLMVRRPAATATREVARSVLAAGTPCEVELVVARRAPGGSGSLYVEEQLPYAFGSRPRFLLADTDAEQRLRYTVRSDIRGRFLLGPLITRFADPFGMAELRRTSAGTASIVVTPRVVPLPAIDLGGGRAGSGEHRLALAAAGTAEDATVRAYRRGDDLRRVHWRSSARVGDLMVRREEHPWEARATVILDNRRSAHVGEGPSSSLEAAVAAAASVAVHLDEAGYAVRLVTAAGHATSGGETITAVLEALAVVGTTRREMLDVSWAADTGHGGTVVGVFGAHAADDGSRLRRIRQGADTTVALVLDIAQWRSTAPSVDAQLGAFREAGWRGAALGRGQQLEAVWRGLHRTAERRR